jgi:hypothetical protein
MVFRKALFVVLLLFSTTLSENQTLVDDSNSEKRTTGMDYNKTRI